MKYLLLVLILAGCGATDEAVVNVTCYDKDGTVTVRMPHYHGSITMVNNHTLGYWSHKCILERIE